MTPTPEQIAKLPKWAQEYITDTKRDAAIKNALRWTEPVALDVEPPKEWNQLSRGWNYFGSIEHGRVVKACSSNVHHGDGWEKTSSQNPQHLFSTRLLALKALRHETENLCARTLAGIDLQIEQEKEKPTL